MTENTSKSNQTKPVSLFAEASGVGIRGLRPYAMLADGQQADVPLAVSWDIASPEANVAVAQAVVTNTGPAPLRLAGIRWTHENGGQQAMDFPIALAPHYYCTQNYRADYFRAGTLEGDRFFYPLTNQSVEIGWSEDNLFPGVFIFAPERPIGLLIAMASQERLFPIFRLRGKVMGRDKWYLEIEERVAAVPWIELAPGGSLRGEKLLIHLAATCDPQQATGPYFRQLRADGLMSRQAVNPLPSQRIYCTWNYDFFADVDEGKVLAQLPLIKQHFPAVQFVQLDDGYQHYHTPQQRAMIDLCYGGIEPFDAGRFPNGPKALADRIKAAGLRPAIWLGLWASLGSRMFQDHPDWMLHDDSGERMWFPNWSGGKGLLDISVPAVREYLHHVCQTVFGQWGYEGVKLDFSSFGFNHKRARYRHGDKTAIELRHELEAIFRRYLPRDGFFGWCLVAGTAQPFLSQADYFRNAIDINKGDWPSIRRIAFWTTNTNMLLQERPCLVNVDSVGWSGEFDPTRWDTFLNFCAVTGGALEVSGDLRKLDAPRLARLNKSLELSDPLRRVRCLDLAIGPVADPPSLWLAGPSDGTMMLGVFNWSDGPVTIRLDYPDLSACSGPVREAWTGKLLHRAGLPKSIRLNGQQSRLMQFGQPV